MKQDGKNIISEFCKEIPLLTRIQVNNEFAFIRMLSELGFREAKAWTPDEDELLNKLMNLARENTINIMDEIKDYQKDFVDKKAIEYAKFIHDEDFDDPTFERDVSQTIRDFKAGFNAIK